MSEWDRLKLAIWHVVTAENLNDGRYINARDLTESIYEALTELGPVEEMKEALEFYSMAWSDQYGFLASESCEEKEPTDALLSDQGNRAKSAMSVLAPILEERVK